MLFLLLGGSEVEVLGESGKARLAREFNEAADKKAMLGRVELKFVKRMSDSQGVVEAL